MPIKIESDPLQKIFQYGSSMSALIHNTIQKEDHAQALLFASQAVAFHACDKQFANLEQQIACKLGAQANLDSVAGFSDVWLPKSDMDYFQQINGSEEKPIPLFDMKTLR